MSLNADNGGVRGLMELGGSVKNCTIKFCWPNYAVQVDESGGVYFDCEKANGDRYDVVVKLTDCESLEGCEIRQDRSETSRPRIEIIHNKWNSCSSGARSNQEIERAYSGNLWFWIGFGFMSLLRKLKLINK